MKTTDPVAAAAGVLTRVTIAAEAKAEDSEVVPPPVTDVESSAEDLVGAASGGGDGEDHRESGEG